jgi:hypothetical protein
VPSSASVEELIAEGRFGHRREALAELDAVIPPLEHSEDPQTLLLALYGRALLLC